MHRGGTSALAGTLQALGVNFGDRLLPGRADNPLGFFEHLEVIQANDAILQAAGSSWCSPLPPLGTEEGASLARAPLDHAARLLAEQFGGAPLWGLKDPRLCRLLPLWQGVFARLDCAPGYVLIVRAPGEVAASIAKRDEMAARNAQLLWLDHLLSAEASTRGLPRLVVTYDALMADWRGTLAQVAASLDLAWPRPPADPAVAAEIDGFLQPGLRHHQQPDQSGTLRAAQEVYALFQRLAAAPASDPEAVQPILAALDEHRRQAAEWAWQPAEESVRLRREWQKAHEVLGFYEAETQRARSDRALVLEDRVKAQGIIDAQAAEASGLRNDLALVLEDRREAQGIIDALLADLENLRADRRKAQGVLEAYEGEIRQLRGDRERVVADRRKAQTIIEEQASDLRQLRGDFALVVADRQTAQMIIEEQASDLALIVADRQKAQTILEEFETEIRRLRTERGVLVADRQQAQEVLDGYATTVAALRAAQDSLEAGRRQAESALAAQAAEIDARQSECARLREDQSAAQATIAAQADELEALQTEARLLQESPRRALGTAFGTVRRYLKLESAG